MVADHQGGQHQGGVNPTNYSSANAAYWPDNAEACK
jgi:hypothetical protein